MIGCNPGIKAWGEGMLVVLLLATSNVNAQCNLSSAPASVDYGVVRALSAGTSADGYLLSERLVTLSVNCSTPQPVILQFRAELPQDATFRFARHGALRINLIDAQHAGKALQLQRRNSQRGTDAVVSSQINNVHNGDIIQFYEGQNPASGRRFTLVMAIQPRLHQQDFQVRDKTSTATPLYISLHP
ncbi:hypothetical protein N5923_24190 [Erwiniaceae bacterium BAC15a-03b]|uniref:Type 1 fimbria pilin n=1 Tax=Winslowiella arboricola TaxID=2978220 RepID=A0A9J6PVB8_9GAMM|nr:hypothetical protein [Winslowiella arboricola]MCU5772974.1 hypothetical protein [Winslowiella arboricola]MCU5780598.1 hypothetical protein [Winslowiella arboricola]